MTKKTPFSPPPTALIPTWAWACVMVLALCLGGSLPEAQARGSQSGVSKVKQRARVVKAQNKASIPVRQKASPRKTSTRKAVAQSRRRGSTTTRRSTTTRSRRGSTTTRRSTTTRSRRGTTTTRSRRAATTHNRRGTTTTRSRRGVTTRRTTTRSRRTRRHRAYYRSYRYGHRARSLPYGYRRVYYGGAPYYYYDGYYYQGGPGGYVVVAPPVGIQLATLPLGYRRVYYGNSAYYVWRGNYYAWSAPHRAYVVVDCPSGFVDDEEVIIGEPEPEPPAAAPRDERYQAQPASANIQDLVAYPARGQSNEQRQSDRQACDQWAVQESFFDPVVDNASTSPGKADTYVRSFGACMEGRGYTIR